MMMKKDYMRYFGLSFFNLTMQSFRNIGAIKAPVLLLKKDPESSVRTRAGARHAARASLQIGQLDDADDSKNICTQTIYSSCHGILSNYNKSV